MVRFSAMTSRSVRRRCEKDLREVLRDPGLEHPFSVHAFCELIAERRGRPVHLRPLTPTETETPSGMWWATDNADYLFYDARTSKYQQSLIIFHEIGHMLLQHECPGIADNEYLNNRIDADDPDWVRQIASRIRYNSREEREAEQLATLIRNAVGTAPAPSPHSGILARLEAALGFHRDGR